MKILLAFRGCGIPGLRPRTVRGWTKYSRIIGSTSSSLYEGSCGTSRIPSRLNFERSVPSFICVICIICEKVRVDDIMQL
jgi:hypothetical protein